MSYKEWETSYRLDSPKWPVKTQHWRDTLYPRCMTITKSKQRLNVKMQNVTNMSGQLTSTSWPRLSYFLPQGTPINAMLSSVLFDKEEWETPNTFNPQHFLDPDGQFRRRDAFLPFSAGFNPNAFTFSPTNKPTTVFDGNVKNVIKLLFLSPPNAGKRVCIGEQLARMELFLFFTSLLQRFSFTPVPGEMPSMEGVLGFTHSPQTFKMVALPR